MTTDLATGRYDEGFGGFSALVTGDDTFQKVKFLTDVREVLLVGRTTADDYVQWALETEFQFSFNSDGSNWVPLNNLLLEPMRLGNPIECYIKAAAGTVVVLTGLF